MMYMLNLLISGYRFVDRAGVTTGGIPVVMVERDGVYSSVGLHPLHRTWAAS